jgi:TP901 family phage tail tape measure protein
MEDNLGQVKVLITPVIDQSRLDSGITDAAEKMAARFDKAFTGRGQPLGRITGKVTEFEKSMEAANARVIAFGASAGGIYLVKSAFDKLVSSTIDVEKNLTNINMILGLGSSSLKTFSAEMFKAASASGQTFETASKVALEFARHGVSAVETSKRMSSAMQLMRISGLDAGESVDVLTASINSFNKEALTSADVVNRLTAVDTKFAVSAQDLAKAIERVGSTAAEAGIQFNQLLGFVTAAQTQTSRGGAVIGNAFKSIFTRLARPEVLSDLQAVGVTTKDAAGQILPMVQIMKNLASQYSHLGAAQKSFISETVGGVYQVNILKASLADLGNGITIFDKVAATAANSAGVVDKRMAQLNETISSKLNVSANQLTELFSNLGNVSFGGNMKKGLDSVNSQLDFVKRQLADFSEDDTFGQSFGKTIGRGLADAFGNILSGPGLQIGAMLLTKVVVGLGKFAIDAGKNMMGMTDALKAQQGLLSSVGNFLQNHKTLLAELESGQISINEVTELYLADLGKEEAHFAAMARYQREIASLARPSLSAEAFAESKTKGASAGYIPAFAQEERDARSKGASPSVRAMFGPNIPGIGPTIINSEEVVKQNYGGSGQPAILRTYGPPGPTKLSGGLVPNLANILGTISVEGIRYQKPDKKSFQDFDYPFIDLLSMIQGQYGRQILPISAKSGIEAVSKVGHPGNWNIRGFNKPGAIANYLQELSRPEMFVQESSERLRHIRSSKEVFKNRFINQIGAYNTQGFENLEFLNPVVFGAKEKGQEIYHQMQKQPLLSSAEEFPAIKSARNFPWYRGGKSFSPTTMVENENIIRGPKTYGAWYEDYIQKFLKAHPDILSLIGPGMTTESQAQLNQLLRNFSKDYEGEERFFEEKYIKKSGGHIPNFGKIISKGGSDLDLSEDGTLKIHYLASSISNNVFPELLEALNSGEITKIDGGTIVGPKVPNLIHHLSKLLPKLRKINPKIPSSIPITGYFTPNDLYRNAFRNRGEMVTRNVLDSEHQKKLKELASSQGLRIVKTGSYTRFVKKEDKNDFNTAYEVKVPGERSPRYGLFTEEDIQGIFPQATFTPKTQRDLFSSNTTARKDLTQLRAAVKAMAGANRQNVEDRFGREYIELSKVYPRGLASGYNPIADAFSRENSPTAKLGFSSRVKSSGNPGGALVYDSSYQNGPEDAIRQHLMSGRPDVVNAGTPNEKIPNFAMDMSAISSIALGAMQGTGLSDWTSKKMPEISYGFDKMQHAVGTATEKLLLMQKQLEAGQNVKYGGQSYAPDQSIELTNAFKKAFDEKFKGKGFQFGTSQEELKSQQAAYIPYIQKIQEKEQGIRSRGFAASMIAPAVGGIVSQGLQAGGYLNASKAVSALTDSATMAAQFMIAFPNRVGTALSGAVMASGVSNALNEMVYKTGTLERAFDLTSTRLEKTASAVNTINQSYDALDSALKSGSISTSQLVALQRNLAKSYSELGAVKGGGAIVAAMKGAGTAEARATAGAEAVDALQNERNKSSFQLAFAKQQQARSEFGINFGKGAQGNLTPRNRQEQIENIELMRSAASNIQGEFITAQSKKGGNAELVQRMATGVISRSDVETIKKGAKETESYKDLEKADPKAAAAVIEELNRQLQEVAIPDDQISAYKESLAKLKSLQIQEVYLRQNYNQSLQNKLQSGSIASAMANTKNIYGIQSKGIQEGYEYSKKEKGLGLEALYTGEQSMILKRGKEEQAHIAEQTSLKAQAVKAQGGAEIGSLISGEIGKFISSSLGTAEASGKTGTVQPSEALSKATEYLGARQKEFSGAGGAEKLFELQQKATSPDEFAKSYLGEFKDFQAGTGGKGTEADYKTLLSQISTMSAGDINEKMLKTLLDIQKVDEEGNAQQKESSDQMIAAIAASKFKEAAGQLGGTGILDRNTFRQQRREIRRAESKLRSRDAGVRGEGAARLLAAIPESQRDYNDPYIKKLYDAASGGIASRQARTLQGTGIGKYMVSGAEAGQAAIFERFKGTNLPIPKSVKEGLEQMKKGQGVNPEFDAALKKSAKSLKLSTDAVDAFATKINSFNSAIDIGQKTGAIAQNKAEQDQVKAEMEKQKGELPAGTAKSSEAILPITDSLITRYGQDTVRLLTDILGAMIALRILGGKGAISEVGAGIAAGGRKVMGGIKSIGRAFGIGAAAEGSVAAGGAIATEAVTAAKGTIKVDLAAQQAKALEKQMAYIPESFGGPKAPGPSFGEVLPGELTHLEPTSQLKPQFKPGVPVTDAEINSALNAGRESGRQAASTSRAIAATEQAAKTASEASKAGKVLGMGAKVGKFVGGSPLLGDLVDVASIGAGAISGGGNISETMGDMMLESAKERVNKPGGHMGGDFLAGMTVRGMTSSFLAKDVSKMQEGEGGINRLENAIKMKELIKSQGGNIKNAELFSPDFRKNLLNPEWQQSHGLAPHLDKSGGIVAPTGAAIPTGDAAAKATGQKPESEASKTEKKPAEPQKVDVKMSAEPLHVNVTVTDENGKKIQEMQQQIVQFKQKLEEVTGNKTPAAITK